MVGTPVLAIQSTSRRSANLPLEAVSLILPAHDPAGGGHGEMDRTPRTRPPLTVLSKFLINPSRILMLLCSIVQVWIESENDVVSGGLRPWHRPTEMLMHDELERTASDVSIAVPFHLPSPCAAWPSPVENRAPYRQIDHAPSSQFLAIQISAEFARLLAVLTTEHDRRRDGQLSEERRQRDPEAWSHDRFFGTKIERDAHETGIRKFFGHGPHVAAEDVPAPVLTKLDIQDSHFENVADVRAPGSKHEDLRISDESWQDRACLCLADISSHRGCGLGWVRRPQFPKPVRPLSFIGRQIPLTGRRRHDLPYRQHHPVAIDSIIAHVAIESTTIARRMPAMPRSGVGPLSDVDVMCCP